LSLPSSFGGSAYTRKSVKKEDGAISVVTQDIVSVKSDTESVNTETQLALRVEKETKPMMHLVRLLKEMDPGAENNTDSKNNAIASLINEFEEEVVNIEQRIINPMLTNGEEGVDDKLKQIMEGLPPDWIALIDEDSGDVYYSNEVRAMYAYAVACDVCKVISTHICNFYTRLLGRQLGKISQCLHLVSLIH
jgi:hypothetical protein